MPLRDITQNLAGTTGRIATSIGVGLLLATQEVPARETEERMPIRAFSLHTGSITDDFENKEWEVFGAIALDQQFNATDIDRIDPAIFSRFQFGFGDAQFDLHGGGASTPLSRQMNLSFTVLGTTLNLVGGAADKSAWAYDALPYFNGNFRDGFSGAAWRWNGIAFSSQLTQSLSLNGSHVRIDLADRVDPGLWQAGFDWNALSASYFQVQRNHTRISGGLDLSLDLGKLGLGYSEFSDMNQHVMHAARAAWTGGRHSLIGLSVETGTSPFNGLDETRFMLSWHYIPGSPWISGSPMASEFRHGASYYLKNMAMLGVIVAGAAAVASASTEADGGEGGYATQHQAAHAILNEVNPKSVRENREYGGWIFRAKDDTYSYTTPNAGEVDRVSLGDKPRGTTAAYHTHGGENPGYDGEHFSSLDIRLYERFDIDGYLGTPKGRWMFYSHGSGSISQIGSVAN